MDTVTFAIHAGLWLLGFVFLFHIALCHRRGDSSVSYPPTSVIIPARNEESALPHLLASLRQQTHLPDEVIVVDDESQDRTREVALREGVRVVDSQPLPEGWTGKSWACHQGAEVAAGEMLVFLDADTSLEADGLQRILDTYLERAGVMSIQPYHRTKRLYEELSAYFNLVLMGSIDAFSVFGKLLKPTALFGPVLVLSREQYRRSGGHEEVRGKLLEDIALAKELRKQGVPLRCYGGKGTVSFRMYPHGLRQLVDGWSKGFAMGAVQVAIPSLVMVVAWIVGSIGTVRYLVQSSLGASTVAIGAWGALYLGYAAQTYWMLFRIGSFRPYTALLYPIPLLFFILVFARSLILVFVLRRVSWKERTIEMKGRRSG